MKLFCACAYELLKLENTLFLFDVYVFCLHVYYVPLTRAWRCSCTCVFHIHTHAWCSWRPGECQIPWTLRHWQLWTSIWVLGMELLSSAKASALSTGHLCSHWERPLQRKRQTDRQRERQRQRMEMSLQYYYYTYIIMQCIIIHVICYKYNIIINYINNSIIILLFHHEAEAEGWWIEVSLGYIARPCPHKYSLEMKTTIKSIVILIQQKVHLKRRNCVTF